MKKNKKFILLFAMIFIVIGGYFLFRYMKMVYQKVPVTEIITDTIEINPIEVKEYGIPVDSFIILKENVQRDQTLSKILASLNVDYQTIDKISQKSDTIFDWRKIRAGNQYAVFLNKTQDSISNLAYFIYEHDPIEYMIVDLRDSVVVTKVKKEIITIKKEVSGVINTSLWNAIHDNNLNPILSNKLEDIFAWTVDFFGIQKNDKFKVIFDEEFVDSISIGIGKIYGAVFNYGGQDIYAIPFEQDSIVNFFDQEGNSLRKAFLKAPLRFSRITSRFSNSRLHPILKIRRPHHGIDYAAPVGTPVYAIGDGKVIAANNSGGAGKMVKIKHNSIYTTAYLHLSKYGPGISAGVFVHQGQIIGYVGSTGLSTGPHLDFRFYKSGNPIDPLKVEAPPVEPVKSENLENFNKIKEKVINTLKNIRY